MSESTTLETLVLEINSSAKGANEGITNLINPLRSLAKAVGTVVPGLREMNKELRQTARLKIPNVGRAISGSAKKPKVASVISESAEKFMPGTPYNLDPKFWNSLDQGSQKVFEKVYRYQYHQQQLAEQQRRQAELEERRRQFNESLKPNAATNAIVQAQQNNQLAKSIKNVGDATQQSTPKVSKWAKLFSTIGRIFKTMLIRTAIRSLIKAFGESWNAVYEFSNAMGGSFANAIDATRTMLADTATTIVQTFAPVLEALVPIIKVVTDSINYLCKAIQYLLSLFGMTSDVTSAATSDINKYLGASGKSGKATKNMLASWDQLNVIQSQGGSGGGSGSSYKPGSLSKYVNAETNAITQLITGEVMLALGLLLACTGHIGLGLGMIAIGAGAIAKTAFVDYSKLPAEIQKVLTDILLIAADAMVAVGFLVMGLNPALGIGLIAAGIANFGLAIGLNWTSIVEDVKKVMTDIGDWFVEKWDAITTAASGAWDSVKKWWETNVVENMEKEGVWGGVKGFFKGIWDEISDGATTAWTILNDFMDDNIGMSFRSAWGEVSDIFKSVFGTTEQPDTVVGMIHGAFQDASEWWTTNVTEKMEKEGVWGGVKGFFQGIFTGEDGNGGILGAFNSMWDGISTFWADNVTKPIEDAWGNIASWFELNITRPIRDSFIYMINRIVDGLNWFIDGLNSIGTISIPGVFEGKLFEIPRVEYISVGANGLFDIPRGDLFIANEQEAELVGSINGKTSVANQQQIIEGIQKGVRDANREQNELLRRQNELLLGILEKSGKYEIKPSAEWGRFNQRSAELWSGVTGR